MKRVGLFFGSFNPLTLAHVALAKGVLGKGLVEEVWFVLSPANPAKVKKNVLADEEHRREMMRAFITMEGNDALRLCDVEYDLPRPSYTHRTLSVLKEKHPNLEFFILCGSDTLSKILSWKTGTMIAAENHFICSIRDGHQPEWPESAKEKTQLVELDIPVLSSTMVRGNISSGATYNTMVPAPIAEYIQKHGLYQNP